MGGRSLFLGLYSIPLVLLGLAFANLFADAAADTAAIAKNNELAELLVEPKPNFPALSKLADQTFLALAQNTGQQQITSRLKSGGTLAVVLDDAGIGRTEAAYAIAALSQVFNPRNLRAGQDLHLSVEQEQTTNARHLTGLVVRVAAERTVMVNRQANGDFIARELVRETRRELVRAKGNIQNSLYVSALDAGASDAIIIEFSRLYAYSVDFQRGIRSGDGFEMVFERFVDERGNLVKTGDLVYARLQPRSRDLPLYRYQTQDGEVGFYNQKGESARRFLMKTPIDGARISSGFGRRKHPVLGYTRAHKGTDFAAGTGTPILAAGNGTVERANRFSSYGNYVRIRHANGFKTAYAHMSKFGRGVKKGRRVSQGQIIGYVGATGRVTGPHLHYEVLKKGKQVNPMRVKLPSGRKLQKSELPAFEQNRQAIEKQIAQANPAIVASSES
ncbi:Peptidase, M23/M37 family [hydrothermal vent metagenome]|uniref:Peptidase, M23/M37 family n=1 Tax=hydrothermal vent metagenome TaxID=652676 RepID=A0A3B0SD55_9ZZZZ